MLKFGTYYNSAGDISNLTAASKLIGSYDLNPTISYLFSFQEHYDAKDSNQKAAFIMTQSKLEHLPLYLCIHNLSFTFTTIPELHT